MTTLRKVALWVLGVAMIVLSVLWVTGSFWPVYRWLVRYFQPEVWSALGTWFTAAIAIVTVLVAGRYAKEQVDEARRTREEQAQPNVVLYSEPNPAIWHFLEIVVKNFGTTPAYDIRISITPQLQATPNNFSAGKIVDVPVPKRIAILAPGQAWKTIWDTAPDRTQHLRDLGKKLAKVQIPLLDYYDQIPNRRHTATVTYTDSKRQKRYETEAELNFNMLDGTTQADINTVHNLTREVERARNELRDMAKTLKAYSEDEHKGIWVYVADADGERQYRADEAQRILDSIGLYKQRVQEAQQRNAQRRAAKREDESNSTGETDDDTAAGEADDQNEN